MATVQILLVRHAHAGRKEKSREADELRPLNLRGLGQAENLVNVLLPAQPFRVISSPYLRCVQTMEPLVAQLGVDLERSPSLGPDASDQALKLIGELSLADCPTVFVLCTHGEVMADVLTQLAEDGNVKMTRHLPGLKGCVWVLDITDGELTGAKYVAPRASTRR
jgi:8-oxo-(d)GTP phosphatase